MAIIYNAQLTPTKLELLSSWVRTQPWWNWQDSAVAAVGAYRFDDPAGEVGIETHLLRVSGGPVVQVPVTYRGAALPEGEQSLVGRTLHSVLGTRWVYDGCADPIYANALARAIPAGEPQAEMQVQTGTGYQPRELTTLVTGSGRPGTPVVPAGAVTTTTDTNTSTVDTPFWQLTLRHTLDGEPAPAGGDIQTLTGRWPGEDVAVLLALGRALG